MDLVLGNVMYHLENDKSTVFAVDQVLSKAGLSCAEENSLPVVSSCHTNQTHTHTRPHKHIHMHKRTNPEVRKRYLSSHSTIVLIIIE